MSYSWSLDKLYVSYDSQEFVNDLEKLQNAGNVMKSFCEKELSNYENTAKKIEEYLKLTSDYNALASRLTAYSSLRVSTNSKDKDANAFMGKIGKFSSELTGPKTAFQIYLKECDNLQEIINSSEFLKQYEFHLNELVEHAKYMLSDKEEILISKMKLTGSAAWAKLQGKVSSEAVVEIEENNEKKIIPVTALPQLPSTDDVNVKKKRFEAECRAYDTYAEISAACLNNLKGEVIALSDLRGYNSPLEMTLNECRMDQETLNALIGSIEDYLPELRRYFKIKAKLLKYDKGLPFFDVSASVGKSNKKYTIEEAKELVLKSFKAFSQEMHDFAKEAFDNNWIDYEPKAGKRSGAFCMGVYAIKESRILTNFNGNIKDINTLAHELGHGYHGRQLATENIFNNAYPMPLAETASTFCEEVLKNELLKHITDEEKLSFLSFSLLSGIQVTVDILSRYYFESEFMDKRNDRELSVDEIKKLMIDAQKKSYGDGLDPELLNPYMWLNKVHYYMPQRNFYNFPYAFGLLFSLGLYSLYEQKGESFVNEYNNLLKSTGKMKIYDVCKLVGIDVRDKAFWKMSLDKIVESIDEFEKLAESYI